MKRRLQTTEKIVALTFDDGPNEPYTSELLDLLKAEGIHATFFVVGANAKKYPGVVQRIVAEGHTLGNHSTNHLFRNYFLQPSFRREIEETQKILEEIAGLRPRFFRSPWLFRHPLLLRSVKRARLTAVFGVFGSEWEVFQRNPQAMMQRALHKLQPGTIYIFHDGYNNKGAYRGATVEALRQLIPLLRAQGYRFVTIEDAL
ncbi:MAG: polysaccharide deacetylase family protein [Candidatus Kerfeldbacteria bacterium]|nr:polysaccharide deacetylase family protein [Candidatus Kerfeldbacteria bacterium]